MSTLNYLNYEAISTALANRKPFRGNSMRATQGTLNGTGKLPSEQAALYAEAAGAGRIVYTVISYRTPIAWVLSDGQRVIPDVHYSTTTSRQQNLCRTYL